MDTFMTLFDQNIWLQLIFIILVALLVQFIINTFIGMFVDRVMRNHRYNSNVDAKKQANTLKSVVRTMLGVVLWIVTVLLLLRQVGVNIGALMTGAGLFGVIFGFGAQNMIKDFVAGLFIIGENQYRVGDQIEVQVLGTRISGTVEDLTIRITKLRDLDGDLHIVGNGTPLAVTNRSFKYANVNVDFMIKYDTDIAKVRKIIDSVGDAMARDESWGMVIDQPIKFLRVERLEDSGVKIKALGRVEPAEQWAIAGEFRERLLTEARKEGVVIGI